MSASKLLKYARLTVHFAFTGLNSKPKASQLLRFFKLNNDISKKEDNRSDHSQEVISKENEENFHSRPPKCKLPKNCTEDAKSSTVKKSFRPHDYDYDDEDDDEDYDDFRSSNDYPEDDEFPEEDTIGSYRAFEDSPPRPRDPGPSAEDYEDDHESDYEFEDEPRDRPRYEDDLDQERDRWDWESPLWHHGMLLHQTQQNVVPSVHSVDNGNEVFFSFFFFVT